MGKRGKVRVKKTASSSTVEQNNPCEVYISLTFTIIIITTAIITLTTMIIAQIITIIIKNQTDLWFFNKDKLYIYFLFTFSFFFL